MSRGTIRVRGHVGMHLGAFMTGGAIEVNGDAGDWLGAEMRDGRIRVRGNVGGQTGAAYRGAAAGMSGGMGGCRRRPGQPGRGEGGQDRHRQPGAEHEAGVSGPHR